MISRNDSHSGVAAVRVTCIAVAAWLAGVCVQAEDKPTQEPASGGASAAAPAAQPPAAPLEARLTDGSVIHVKLLDDNIPLATEFGKLSIPSAAIRSIDFATRIPRATAERVKAAIARLGDKDFQEREAAIAELLALDSAAYAALKAAVESPDAEVVLRADRLLAQLNTAVPEAQRENFPRDVVYAGNSQIEGTIELDSLKVETLPFGTQSLKIEMLRQLGTGLEVDETPTAVLPDPGVLMNFQGQTGRTLYFRISAAANGLQNGAVWGRTCTRPTRSWRWPPCTPG